MTIECNSCDSIYTIKYDDSSVDGMPCYCPFCGCDVEIDITDEDNGPYINDEE